MENQQNPPTRNNGDNNITKSSPNRRPKKQKVQKNHVSTQTSENVVVDLSTIPVLESFQLTHNL